MAVGGKGMRRESRRGEETWRNTNDLAYSPTLNSLSLSLFLSLFILFFIILILLLAPILVFYSNKNTIPLVERGERTVSERTAPDIV